MKIFLIEYKGNEELHIILEDGNPTELLMKAHSIAQIILGNARWHFTSIELQPPNECENDSNWDIVAYARNK